MSAFTNSNDYLDGRKAVPTPSGPEVVAARFTIALVAADLDSGDIGNVAILPAGCLPVSLQIDSDDLDTGTPALVWSVGVSNGAVTDNVQTKAGTDLSTDAADGGAAWGTNITVSQAGGMVDVLSKALSRVTKKEYDRYIMLKATTAAATGAAGTLGLTLSYRAA